MKSFARRQTLRMRIPRPHLSHNKSANPASGSMALENRLKKLTFIATIVSTLSLICGGAYGFHKDIQLRKEANELAAYTHKQDVYFELVNAAASIGSSLTKSEAKTNLANFDRIYFGRAHMYPISSLVNQEKIDFYKIAHFSFEKQRFPSIELQTYALRLAMICQIDLDCDPNFSNDSYASSCQKNLNDANLTPRQAYRFIADHPAAN